MEPKFTLSQASLPTIKKKNKTNLVWSFNGNTFVSFGPNIIWSHMSVYVHAHTRTGCFF